VNVWVGVRVGVAVRLPALVGVLVGDGFCDVAGVDVGTFVAVVVGGELAREKLPKLTIPASAWPFALPVWGSSWKKVNDTHKITAN
jgi:hypothetical protein